MAALAAKGPRRHCGSSPASSQQGQALAETVVVLLALSLFLVLIPVLGKLQDIAHQTQMASRYVAWSAMVQNDAVGGDFADAAQLEKDVRRRFFGPSNAPVFTGDDVLNQDSYRNPMWNDHQGKPILADFNEVSVAYGPSNSQNPSDGYSHGGTLDSVYPAPLSARPSHFALADKGLLTGAVQVKLANVTGEWLAPFDALDLSIRRHTSVMPDTFAVPTAAWVDSRVSHDNLIFGQPLLRMLAVAPVIPILALEDGSMMAPQLGELDFWRDVVPSDRTKAP